MKKLRNTALFLIIFIMMFALPLSAATSSAPKIIDDAGLLSEEEAAEVSSKLEEMSVALDLDIVIVTKDSIDGQTATEYADSYYDQNGYSEDGILLLLAMDSRDYAFTTKGYAIEAFTDAGIDYIDDECMSLISEGKYANAFEKYADLCGSFVEQARNGSPYDNGQMPKKNNTFLYLIISVVLGLIFAAFSTGSKKSALKSVHKEAMASNYVTNNNITAQRDILLNRKVIAIPKEKESKSSGSTTHKSSSGSTHGGKSGKF